MKEIIGKNAFVDVLNYKNIPAKIDTGADSSAICVSDVSIAEDNILRFKLFYPGSPFYDGKVIEYKDYRAILTRSSHGEEKICYRVYLPLTICNHKIKTLFNLSDRSKNYFPILIGRRTISRKFLVDVSRGPVPIKKPKSHHLNRRLKANPYLFHQEYIVKKKGKIS